MADTGIGRQAAAEIAAAQAAKGKAENKGKVGGHLGKWFHRVEWFSLSNTVDQLDKSGKNPDGSPKPPETKSRKIGGMVGWLHVSDEQIGPFNIKLVTRLDDGSQSIVATFPAASQYIWCGPFIALNQRTLEASERRDAIKAELVAGFLAHRKIEMSKPAEQRPVLVKRTGSAMSAEELEALGLM